MPSASYAIAKYGLIKEERFIMEVVRCIDKRNYSHYENNFNKTSDANGQRFAIASQAKIQNFSSLVCNIKVIIGDRTTRELLI